MNKKCFCFWGSLGLVLSLVFLSGCGKSLPLGSVTGTVTYQGKPVADGKITFVVAGTRDGMARIVNGQIVEASTFKKGDGIALGQAQLSIFADKIVGQKKVHGEEDPNTVLTVDIRELAIPKKYTQIETSELTFEIKKGKNVINLELTD
ncbi:MAG: hypothetical protein PHQ75_10235 [Thermoguttaceae bacterium]|nr:hypothetical protein [Thermoguttaceae bacterium]